MHFYFAQWSPENFAARVQLSGRLKSTNTRMQNVLGYACISSKVSNILDFLNEPFSQKKGGFQLEFSIIYRFCSFGRAREKEDWRRNSVESSEASNSGWGEDNKR